ncbi:MAG: PDZ domain-containing protein [Gammaproteobacteria bacterium]|nr:PDZ domain-containing protein [Gammaproteobacteria bacterium]
MKALPLIIVTLTTGFTIGYFVNSILLSTEPAASTSQINSVSNIEANSYRDSPVVDQLSVDLDALDRRLQQEIVARKSLEEKLDNLSQQIASLERNKNDSHNIDNVPEENEEVVASTESDREWFNEQALVDSGMSDIQAAGLKSFFEQQELDRMYLRDQSIREGWDRQRYREEIQKLSEKADTFLSQLDDTSYDAYLYASGQPNRVRVTNVLDSSQAGSAGIQAGDHIISYDNKRIYSGFDLRSATTGGNINQTVAVEIERNGEIMELYLNRGPLGIRMNSVSIAPTP